MNKLLKKICTVILSLVVIIGFISSTSINSYAYNSTTINEYINQTASLMYKTIPEPTVASIGGEWTVLSLARSGVKVPKSYYDDYYKRVEQTLKDCDGQLHKIKYTEYSRVILALTAINKDVINVAGYNLLSYLSDFNKVKKQGINGPIFALIAFDTKNYEIPQDPNAQVQNTRQMMIDYILDKEIYKGTSNAGGWALSGNDPDPDITFMAIQALSNYMDQPKVKEAVDRALTIMSKKQLASGGYSSWGSVNCESTAQAIVALTALGINLDQDSRFIKTDSNGNKKTLVDGMLHFYCEGGGFAHITEGYDGGGGSGTGLNAMATDQGMYALVAYNRYLKGQNKLYNMTDASTTLNIGDNSNLDNKGDNGGNSNNNQSNGNGTGGSGTKPDVTDPPGTNSPGSSSGGNASNGGGSSSGGNTTTSNGQGKTTGDSSGKKTSIPKSGSKNVDTSQNTNKTISIKTVYSGEKDGLIPENKKCVIIEFNEKTDEEIGRFKSSEDEWQNIYYSKELSEKSGIQTYITLIDTSVSKDDLLNIDNYEFHEIESSKDDSDKKEQDYKHPEKYELIFGDVNGDKVVNAQDVLDIQSILCGKIDLANEKQILAINVSMDSKIDNGDIEQIINYFISKSDYTIFTLWNEAGGKSENDEQTSTDGENKNNESHKVNQDSKSNTVDRKNTNN